MEKHRLEALRLRRRRYLVAFLLLAMMSIAIAPSFATAGAGRVVQLDARQPVSGIIEAETPVSMTITDPLWGDTRLTDYGELFEFNQLTRKIPQATGHFPGDGPDKISGLLTYADGTVKNFSLTSVFRLEGQVYYDETKHEEIKSMTKALESKLYTLSKLGGFLNGDYAASLSNDEESLELQPEDFALIQNVLSHAETVEDRDEAALTVKNRVPRYTICVRDARDADLIVMDIYSNQSTLVYDKYAGLRYVLCFSSELDDLCKLYLEPAGDPAS